MVKAAASIAAAFGAWPLNLDQQAAAVDPSGTGAQVPSFGATHSRTYCVAPAVGNAPTMVIVANRSNPPLAPDCAMLLPVKLTPRPDATIVIAAALPAVVSLVDARILTAGVAVPIPTDAEVPAFQV